jgi:hypothetical protein
MSAINYINHVPAKLLTDCIVPQLGMDMYSFSCVSKDCNVIAQKAAKKLRIIDITFMGEKVITVPGNLLDVLRVQLKTDYLFKRPSIFSYEFQKIKNVVGDKPVDILSLFKVAHKKEGRIMPVIALFDLQTALIPAKNRNGCDLVTALNKAIQHRPELIRALLSHPNAAKISAEDIEDLLETAKRYNVDPKIVGRILSLLARKLHAENIPVEGPYGLRAALDPRAWANLPSPELFEALYSHPNAAGIRKEGLYGNRKA